MKFVLLSAVPIKDTREKGICGMMRMPNFQELQKKLFLILVLLGGFITPCLFAGTVTAPGSGVPVPVGTWVKVLTRDLPVQTNDWEQLVYISAIQRSMMLSQYHQNNSEPNESLIGYNFDTNSWDVMDMGGLFHTENMPEGGESQGYFDFNPLNNTIEYHCCTSGSNQAENVNHTWWFDVVGQSGRDEETPVEPNSLQAGGAFDVAHNVAVLYGGASYVGTWLYSPVTNAWQPIQALGIVPDPSVILPGMAYDSAAQHVFLYGGKSSSGTTYYPDLYYYDVPSNTWSIISPANGVKPPARCCMNFAYDSTNNIFLLYGGKNASGVLGDTWAYNPTTNLWTQLTPSVSPPVNSVSDFTKLAYDSDHNVFVLAHIDSGGYFGGNWTSLAMQTWLFRYAGTGPNAATQLSTTDPSPGSVDRNLQSWGKDPALAASGSSLYLSWSETGSPFDTSQAAWPHIYADQYSGGNWTTMGSYSSISQSTVEAHAPSLTIVGNTPWISFYQNIDRVPQVYAESWNGSTWQGGPIGLISTGNAVQGRSFITSVAGQPYIGVIEVNKTVSPQTAYAYVKNWNGTSWTPVGTGALNSVTTAGTTATSISLASDGTYPYAAWTEYLRTNNVSNGQTNTAPQTYVSHWNGTQWIRLGGSLNIAGSSGWANDASLAYFSGQPYVAWTERSQTGNAQLYIATWNGSAWVLTGSGSLDIGGSNGWAYRPSLVAAGTNLYVAWVEQTSLGEKARAFVSQYVNGSWTPLGGPLNMDPVNGSAQRVSLGIQNGQPVAAWSEVILGTVRRVYVSQWNGSSWTLLSGNSVTDTTPPTKPSSLAALAVSNTQINLAWTGSTDLVGVYGYNIYRNGALVANVTSSDSYQDTGLTPSTTYEYTVAAYDAAGNVSAQSSQVSATTPANSNGPTVSFTAPSSGAIVSGTTTVSVNATDSIGIASVQFQLDGANLGSPVMGQGPGYSMSWNTTMASNGAHTLSAIATDNSNLTATASISVTVSNSTKIIEPVISGVAATAVSSTGATILWTTDEPSSSQVEYGTTSNYGSNSTLNSTPVTSHSVVLSGLQPSTTYDYAVISQDSQGNTDTSGNMVFTTSAAGLQTMLQIQGNSSEVTGTTNGSAMTPSVTPGGFTGTVAVNGTGSVNFTPAQSGNGVYFLNCCGNTNNAFYNFTGSALGDIFKNTQGQVSFTLQSNYSFAQRESKAAAARYTFDARDGSGKHQFGFLTSVSGSQLEFTYTVGGISHVYYVPTGTEDTLFGQGVLLQVTINWGPGGASLYLNGSLSQSTGYSAPASSWTASSNFDLGAYQYSTYGGYNVSDDTILGFNISAPAQ